MARLFVANCSRQFQVINYRMDFTPPGQPRRFKPPKQQQIPPGRQACLGGDLDIQQIEEIIQQLTRTHNMVGVADLKGRLPPKRCVLLFDIDKSLSKKMIQQVHDHNVAVLRQDGKDRRRLAAVAGNQALMNQLADELAKPAEYVAEFEQEEESEVGEGLVEEGVRVMNDGSAPNGGGSGRGRGGSRRSGGGARQQAA